MDAQHVRLFLSHATADDPVANAIARALQALGHTVWWDSQYLRGGDQLTKEIVDAIENAERFAVLLSRSSLESKWVEKEIRHAQAIQNQRGAKYRIIPILLDGLSHRAVGGLFPEEPVFVKLSSGVGGPR